MLNDKLAILISRYLSKEASPAEQEELFEQLRKDPQQQYLFELLSGFWGTGQASQTKENEDAHFNHILELADGREDAAAAQLLQAPSRPYRKLWRLTAAAAVLITIITSLYYFSSPAPAAHTMQVAAAHQHEVKAISGARSRLTLPDGTKVWLNADSKIMYGNDFNQRFREVMIEGEVFFDVARNANCPFIVHAAGIDIRVLGTAFNVKSYPRDSTIETTLMRGSVEVVKANEPGGARVILRPHEKLVFTKPAADPALAAEKRTASQEMLVTAVRANLPDSAIKETSWMYDKLSFDGDTFRELSVKMERWFNVNIKFKDETAAAYRFKGTFKNESIEDALNALQLTADFRYTINGTNVEIFKGGSR